MIDDGTLILILEMSIGGAIALWGLFFLISKEYRDMIIDWRRRFSKGSNQVTSKKEYDRLRKQKSLAARGGKKVRPVGYIHLDSNLKSDIMMLNILTFLVIISGVISLLTFRNHIFLSVTIGLFIVLVGYYFLFGISRLRRI